MSFALNIIRSMDYRAAVEVKKHETAPAFTQGKQECCRSGFCCWRAPAELTKDDLARLSTHKGITKSEFFKTYCIVDTYGSDDNLILRLRRKHQTAGVMIEAAETYYLSSPCVFLVENGKNNASCEVHEAKPAVCTRYKCWEPTAPEKQIKEEMGKWTREELMELGWDGVNPDDGYGNEDLD